MKDGVQASKGKGGEKWGAAAEAPAETGLIWGEKTYSRLSCSASEVRLDD